MNDPNISAAVMDGVLTVGVDYGAADVLAHAVMAVESAGASPRVVWVNPVTYGRYVAMVNRACRRLRRQSRMARKHRRGYA